MFLSKQIVTACVGLTIAGVALAGNGMGGGGMKLFAAAGATNPCINSLGSDSNTCVYSFANKIANIPASSFPASANIPAGGLPVNVIAYVNNTANSPCWCQGSTTSGSCPTPDSGLPYQSVSPQFDSPDSNNCTGTNVNIIFHTYTSTSDGSYTGVDQFYTVSTPVDTAGDVIGGSMVVAQATAPVIDSSGNVTTKGTLVVTGAPAMH